MSIWYLIFYTYFIYHGQKPRETPGYVLLVLNEFSIVQNSTVHIFVIHSRLSAYFGLATNQPASSM